MAVIVRLAFQPAVRERVRADEVIQRINGAHNAAVIPAGTEGVHQRSKSFISRCVVLFQRFLHGICAEHGHLAVVQNAEIGREIELVKKLAHEIAAKAVDRADVGARHEQLLALQMYVVRGLFQQEGKLPGNARAHLGCRRARKCDNKQSICRSGVFRVREPFDHTLHQNGCLAGTGRCGNQQASPPCADCVTLCLCPLPCHGAPPF